MLPLHLQSDDLAAVVDQAHALFQAWDEAIMNEADAGASTDALGALGREVLKLAVHEWIANLVQHADFAGRRPHVHLALLPTEGADAVRCVIEDNSDGFSFEEALVEQQLRLDRAPVPPERGRGLLMMIACTEDLTYRAAGEGRGGDGAASSALNRLEFRVTHQDPDDLADGSAGIDVLGGGFDEPALLNPIIPPSLDSEEPAPNRPVTG